MEDRVSRFGGLPATPLAWSGVVLAILYAAGATFIARVPIAADIPLGLQWLFGAGVGALALWLLITAYKRGERSWLLFVGIIVAAFWWLQWMILLVIGFFTGGLWS